MDVWEKLRDIIRHKLFFPGLLVVLALAFLWRVGLFNPLKPTETGGFSVDENTPGYENWQRLMQGCPFKDCIPSIDDPQFESVENADRWLEDDDVIFALDYRGEQRAYPQRILNWHEIVNDVVAGDPIAITFCPLCGSSLAFDRRVDGPSTSSGREPLVLEFGISGKLHNNDLVMYDRQTETLWQQITGEGIVGEHFGELLRKIPMDTLRWGEWKALHPQTLVLSRDTGFSRDYSRYPYDDYEQSDSPLFPVEGGVDRTLHPKAIVFGVEVNGSFKAYPEEKLASVQDGEVLDSLGGQQVKITYDRGKVVVENLTTGEEVVATRLFWFAWKAFRPETELYRN